jgi:hypothetical protein
MKKYLLVVILIILIFTVSCTSRTTNTSQNIEHSEILGPINETTAEEDTAEKEIIKPLEKVEKQPEQPKICDRGWKCKNSVTRGFQDAACFWINSEKCEYGCENSTCNPEPVVEVVPESDEETVPPPTVYPTLSTGETVIISGKNVSIFTMDPGQVWFLVDGKRSNPIKEGDTMTFWGVTITVKEILFQGFDGGLRQISYSTG